MEVKGVCNLKGVSSDWGSVYVMKTYLLDGGDYVFSKEHKIGTGWLLGDLFISVHSGVSYTAAFRDYDIFCINSWL